MAFNREYLAKAWYAGGLGAPHKWVYDTADSAATVAGTDYVALGRDHHEMALGDLVLVRFFDSITAKTEYFGSRLFAVAAIDSDGNVTLTLDGVQGVTATADGLTTGLIHDGTTFVTITSANADHIATLPAPIPGMEIIGFVTATGCELRTPANSGITINDVDSDGTAELALAAQQYFRAVGNSLTEWYVHRWTSPGVPSVTNIPD